MTNQLSSTVAKHPITYRGDHVPKWRMIEVTLPSPRAFENPIQEARLTASLTSPSGRKVTWNGFWDGGNEWRLRFSPDEVGQWRYELHLQEVGGAHVASASGSFTADKALDETVFDRHGPIQLSSDKRKLVHADGTPFFWLADTAWNGPLRSTSEEWDFYLANRTRQRFTAVQWVATHWRASETNLEGQRAFNGSEQIAINPEFFQRLDQRLERTTAAGLLNAPVMLWAVGIGANADIDPGYGLPESEAILLARYQVARWAAYPLIWILAGDGKYAGDFAPRWRRIGRATFGDQPHAPVAMHCGGVQWPADDLRDEPWLAILGYQSGHGDDEKARNWIVNGPPATEWNKEPRLFQLNLEPPYENHLGYQSRQPHTPHSVRMAIYWSLLNAPTAGVTYGGHGVWGWDDGTTPPTAHPNTGIPLPWQQALTMPAGEQMAYLADAFTSLAWWTLTPRPSLLLNQPGREDVHKHILVSADDPNDLVVAYTPAGGDIDLDAAIISDSHRATWFNPRTGERQQGEAKIKGNTRTFSTPDGEDWLLILQRK